MSPCPLVLIVDSKTLIISEFEIFLIQPFTYHSTEGYTGLIESHSAFVFLLELLCMSKVTYFVTIGMGDLFSIDTMI